MKRFNKTLFVILVVVMSFVAVPAVFAGTGTGSGSEGPGNGSGGPICTAVVAGEVTALDKYSGEIVVDDETTISGIPLPWLDINVGDQVVVNCLVSLDGKYVACYLTINGGDVIELRP